MHAPTIKDLQVGSTPAWSWFVHEFGAPVTRYARQLGHPDPDDVSGATMETMVRRINQFNGGHPELRSFVFSVAHARIVDELRSSRHRRVVVVSDVPDLVDRPSDIAGFSSNVEGALAGLTEKQRQLIYLRYLQGASTRETACVIGDTEGATRVALSRALRVLREALVGNEVEQKA